MIKLRTFFFIKLRTFFASKSQPPVTAFAHWQALSTLSTINSYLCGNPPSFLKCTLNENDQSQRRKKTGCLSTPSFSLPPIFCRPSGLLPISNILGSDPRLNWIWNEMELSLFAIEAIRGIRGRYLVISRDTKSKWGLGTDLAIHTIAYCNNIRTFLSVFLNLSLSFLTLNF